MILKRILIAACVLLALTIITGVAALQTPGEPTPLQIGFYGPADSPAAQGMQVAVNEINEVGPFTGADGGQYVLQAVVSEDFTDLADAIAVLTIPEAAPLEDTTAYNGPVYLLANSGPLAFENLDATLLRGISTRAYQLRMLANFAVLNNQADPLERVALIGEAEEYGESFAAFQEALRSSAPDRELAIQSIGVVLPSLDELDTLYEANPQLIVYQGTLQDAGALLEVLAASEWSGTFFYPRAYEAAQAGALTPTNFPDAPIQVAGVTPWANSSQDALSQAFLRRYVADTGDAPTARAVSAYDLTWATRLMVTRVGPQPMTLAVSWPTTNPISTTQGTIDPVSYGGSELFRTAAIYALTPQGGMTILSRYDAGRPLTDEELVAQLPTPTPLPSATPSQPVVTVSSNVLNVRTGPGQNYDRVGQLRQGDQVTVVGSVPDFSWYYVQGANGLGWVAAEFVELFNPQGGVEGISQMTVPPTPTPAPTATPGVPADIVIDNVTLNPPQPVVSEQFNASVTVRNAGSTDAGQFAVAATWQPGGVFSSVTVPGLAVFESTTVVLQATLNQAGAATVTVVGDLNNTVPEANETNNNFDVSY
ncbi:MAG: CARDB domain-containing protein, partial [Anaerolineales bacterium]